MAGSPDMQTFASRLATFQQAHHLSKRRASSQSAKRKNAGGNTAEWPHEHPAPEELARAGFFYRPAQESLDNVQCFLCTVKLDGWEAEDDPLREHLAHSTSCAWALSLSVMRLEDSQQEEETRDPLSDELVAARKGTFEVGEGWVHEGKRGWKCKVNKMVEAGWTCDPSPETELDGVTCFYCNLSLDGWEPKDDPFEEHKRRSPECPFFALVESYHPGAAAGAKGKGGKKGKGRASTASKGSRMSTQSAVSAVSIEALDMMPSDLEDEGGAGMEDSIMSTATTASQATVKFKKKGGRKPAAAKGAKGKKRANTVDDEAVPEMQYAEPSQSPQSQHVPGEFAAEPSVVVLAEEYAPPPAKVTKKGTRQSKQAVDSSIMEVSQLETVPKKATRGRKAKAQSQPEPEPESVVEHRMSDVSAQLQEELENSIDHMDIPDNESTPQASVPAAKPKRGVKRTSEGLRKPQDETSVLSVEFPVPSKPVATKGKKGSKQHTAFQEQVVKEDAPAAVEEEKNIDVVEYPQMESEAVQSEAEPEKPKKTAKGKKAGAKKGKGKKTSSARSSKATITASQPESDHDHEDPADEDLARDELEIEAELARIAAEQQAQTSQRPHTDIISESESGKAEEYEPSPSHHHHADKHANRIHELELELQAETMTIPDPSVGMANYMATVAAERLPRGSLLALSQAERSAVLHDSVPELEKEDVSGAPSPNASGSGSDKENEPSSVLQPATALKTQPTILLSPTKTTRIPLAPGTPNRASPSKQQTFPSPSKQHFSRLQSTTPWTAIDLETILLASPQPTPGTLAQRLAAAATAPGAFTSPEKGMSVEEWVRYRAEKGEEELRRRCEEMVGAFEREGVRALESLGGIGVVG